MTFFAARFMTPKTATDVTSGVDMPKSKIAEIVGSAVLLILFAGGLWLALGWSAKAATFPLGVTAIGAALSAAYLIRSCFKKQESPAPAASAAVNLGDNDEDSDYDIDGILLSASAKDWAATLGFMSGFFISLFVLGLYTTAAVFTVAYLKFQAHSTWKLAILYTVILTGLLYVVFSLALQLPVPAGLFEP